MARRRHDPTYMSGGGHHWAVCSCGWKSGQGTATFAQLAHGTHLLFTDASDADEETR